MQREVSLRPTVPFARSLWGVRRDVPSRIAVAGGSVLGAAFVLSLLFEQPFLNAGITPASILLCAVLIGVASTCGSDPLHPARLLALFLGLGFVVGPVVHALTAVYSLPDGAERQQAELGRATWMVLAATILAMLSMRATLGSDWRRDLRSESRARLSRRTLFAAVGVAALGMALLGLYLWLTGTSSVSLEGRGATYAIFPNEGRKAYLSLLAPMGVGGLLLIAAWALERQSRRTFLLVATAACGFGVALALPGSRANLLYAIAPLFFLYAAHRGLPRWRWLAIGVLALMVVLTYGASLRSAETRSTLLRDPWQMLSEKGPSRANLESRFVVDVAHTESLLGAMDAFPATRPFLGGESAALGFTGPVGWKFGQLIGLHADPPAGVTLTAAAYARDPSTFPSGLTATLPGELYANAGVAGVLAGLAAFGAIAGWVRRFAVSSRAPGTLALYAATVTILFAVFADYFGQIYRGGAVLLGVFVALVAGGERGYALVRAAVVACLIGLSAAALLIVRRYVGVPPEALMTSFIPVYLTFAGLFAFLAVRVTRIYCGEAATHE